MKIREVMTDCVIRVDPEETVEVAARTLAQHNIGILPVCESSGRLCGLVTDRDMVIRCVASGRLPSQTMVRDVMTGQVVSAQPDMDAAVAAHLMGRQQVRRLPVLEDGKLCGMVSLGDLAQKKESSKEARDALAEISSILSKRN